MGEARDTLVVEAVGLRKVFKDFWGRPKALAVDGVDFEIRQGEVVGLLGPNGSGKSTTVKMLLGLLNPTGGNLKVFGQATNDVRTKSRIGYLPEETYLYKYLTAGETLDFFAALFNMPAQERRNRTRKLLEMVGLGHSADRPVGEFSKGMARRIGLAQCLVNDPDLVILDEPTSGLDPIGCNDVKNLIRTLAARHKTVILCSHLLADVEDVCDQVLVMYGGQIRARGSLSELLTVEDRTQIDVPIALEPEIIGRIMSILNEVVPSERQSEIRPHQPTLNLEGYFMDVVRRARTEGTKTAGVRDAGAIADYLTGTNAEAGEALLQALTTPAADTRREPPEATAEPAKPEPDLSRLRDLAQPAATPEAGDKSEPTAAAAQQQRNDRLRRLLDKK